MLIASLVLPQVKEVDTVMQKEINSECKTLTYISLVLTILGLVYYIPIKLCKTAGTIHSFKIIGTLKPENIKLNKNYIWNTLEIDWKEVTVTFNANKIKLPRVVTIKLQDKIKIRCLMKEEPLFFHLRLKQRITWFL